VAVRGKEAGWEDLGRWDGAEKRGGKCLEKDAQDDDGDGWISRCLASRRHSRDVGVAVLALDTDSGRALQ